MDFFLLFGTAFNRVQTLFLTGSYYLIPEITILRRYNLYYIMFYVKYLNRVTYAHAMIVVYIGVRVNFLGVEPSLPEYFFDSARKIAMETCKITLPDSPHSLLKITDFGHFIINFIHRKLSDRQNEFCFFFV